MTSCVFGSKNGQHSNASEMYGFKVKCNQQTPKDVKIHFLQNYCLRLSKILVLTPKIKILIFFTNKCLKSKVLSISKKRNMYHRPKCYQHVYKISSQYLYFCLAVVQNPSNGYDVTFLKLDFWIFNCRTTKQMTFGNPETKLDKIGKFWNKIFIFKIWPFLTWT